MTIFDIFSVVFLLLTFRSVRPMMFERVELSFLLLSLIESNEFDGCGLALISFRTLDLAI